MFDWFYKNKEKKSENNKETYIQTEHIMHFNQENVPKRNSTFRFPLIPDDDVSYMQNTHDFTDVHIDEENQHLRSQRMQMKEKLQPVDDWFEMRKNQNIRNDSSDYSTFKERQQRNFRTNTRLHKSEYQANLDTSPAFLRKKNQTIQNHPFQNELQHVDAYRKNSVEDLHIFESQKPKEPQRVFRPTPFVSPVHGRLEDNKMVSKVDEEINIEKSEQERINIENPSFIAENLSTALQLTEEDKISFAESDGQASKNEKIAKEYQVEETGQDATLETFVENEGANVLEQESIVLTEACSEMFEATDKKENVADSLFEETPSNLSMQKESHPIQEKETSTVRSMERVIPVNVLMLHTDKYHLRKRQMEEMKQKKNNLVSTPKPIEDPQPQIQPVKRSNVQCETEVCLYQFPPLDLLNQPTYQEEIQDYSLDEKVAILDQVLKDFHVGGKVVSMTKGPTVTRYEVQPDPGVKVNKIVNLADDLKLYLAAQDIRIEAPIPGKSMVGIEIPNDHPRPVYLREILAHQDFQNQASNTKVALGLNIEGAPVLTDIRKMPHGLIAGSTGSGKSVCMNSILISLLYGAHPDEVKLMLIDPKMVELASYNALPHLVCPVITDAKAATKALKWAVDEMERRYELFSKIGVRDIDRYNTLSSRDPRGVKMPTIIIMIDELADLMMVAANEVESHICRIAQKARACGIHLILATQRPSVDVITGLIKANIPSRIAFSVSSQIDSRTILDSNGAERLLGKGDMLLSENGSSKLVRVQGTYVSDDEIEKVVTFVKKQMAPQYLFAVEEMLVNSSMEDEDELFPDVLEFAIEAGTVSTSMIQRKFRIGYNRAARMIDVLEEKGYISGANGSKPREVLIDQL